MCPDQECKRVAQWTFSDWINAQRQLQLETYGSDYAAFSDDERAESLRMNFTALVVELSEVMGECGWKPWASERGWLNREKYIAEIVDVMHFLGNLLVHADCTGEELTAAYQLKQQENRDRQQRGYTGRKPSIESFDC